MTLTGFAILLMLCALFGHGQSKGTSKKTRSLFTLLNGAYNNGDQVQNENSGNDVINMRFIPAVVSELGPDPVLFVEVEVYGTLSLNVFFVGESSRLPTLSRRTSSSVYNVTSAKLYEKPPGSITVDDVSNLQLVDLQPVYNCVTRYEIIDEKFIIVVRKKCYDKSSSLQVTIVRENDFYVVVPPGANETSTLVPLHFLRKGPRFPIPGETSNSDNADD